jgi:phosphate transport system substrate-binding protein
MRKRTKLGKKRTSSLRLGAAGRKTIAAATLAVASLVTLAVVQATPAMADPTERYVAVGAEATQDIMNQIGLDLGGNVLGSYNSYLSPSTTHDLLAPVKPDGTQCVFTRPDNSAEGVAALRYSVSSGTGATPPAPAPQPGCVDIARSSAGSGSDASTTGQFIYIPFALDAVAGATGPATGGQVIGGVTTVATSITTADQFTLTDLKTLYAQCGTVTEGGITYWPFQIGVTQPAGTQLIDLYVPQLEFGYWAGQLGFSVQAPPACVQKSVRQGADTGQAVEEDDGTAVATDPDGFVPFSVAEWIGQRNMHDDRRHGAVIHSLNGISPFSNGNPATGALNTSFALTREVYNVVQYSRVVGSGADPGLVSMLAGTNSFVCQDSLQIRALGFALLSSSTTDNCGATTDVLRAFPNG